MYVKIKEGITVEEVISLSKNSDGFIGFVSDSTYQKAKDKVTISKETSIEKEVERFIKAGYQYVGIYKSTTGVRGYYRTVVLAK